MNNKRQADEIRRLACSIKPTRFVPATLCQVRCQSDLDPDDHIAMSGNDPFHGFDVAITKIMQFTQQGWDADAADQPLTRDVQQCQYACFGFVDDVMTKAFENQSPRSAEVENGGDAAR